MTDHAPALVLEAIPTSPLVGGGPLVVDGEVLGVVELDDYPRAHTPLGGCTNFTGRYVVDPAEIAEIHQRVERARRRRRWWR